MKKKALNTNENASVEEQATAEEKSVEVAPAEDNSVEVKPANVNRLFNIISLAYAAVLLAAQIFLFVSMSAGIIAVDGVVFNSSGILHFVKLYLLRESVADHGTIICLGFMAVLFLAVAVTTLIGLIKAIIGIFKFIKLGEDYESREARFGKYVRTVSRSYGNAIALIVGSLAFTPSFTGLGTGVVVLGCIIYLASSAIVILFKQVFNKEEKFDLFELLITVGKKLVIFMLAFLLVAGVKESINVGIGNVFIGDFGSSEEMELAGKIYFKVAQPISMVSVYSCVVTAVAYIVKYYPLNNAKKDVNNLLKRPFIALFVLSLFFCICDCVIYGIAYDASAGDYANLIADGWLGYLFVSIAGIIITHTAKTQKEEIRG